MEYGSEALRRFNSPLRVGTLDDGRPGVTSGEAQDQTLKVWVRFQAQVTDGLIQIVRFRVYGCPHTVAAASWVAEWLEGRPAGSMRQLEMTAVAAALGVPVEKFGKLLRIEDAVSACWREYQTRMECDNGCVID